MAMPYKRNYVFRNIDKIIYCAEEREQYGEAKLIPFYYNSEKMIKLFHGDSLELLKKFPDNSIDMIFADPPYLKNRSRIAIDFRFSSNIIYLLNDNNDIRKV